MGDNNQGQNDMQQQPNGGERQNPGQQNQQGGQGQDGLQQQPDNAEQQNQGQQNKQGGQSDKTGQGDTSRERIDTDNDGRTRDPNDTSPTDQGGQA